MHAEPAADHDDLLANVVVVLWETQDYVNIAGTIRAMKNFGLSRLRLVNPTDWDPWRVEGIAHDTGDLIAATRTFDTLDAALADCSYVVAMTARERRAKRAVGRPREVAHEILDRIVRQTGHGVDDARGTEGSGAEGLDREAALIEGAATMEEVGAGPVALLFGREDHGLSNHALDLAHRSVTIPTNPAHSSLNLAQAVLLMAYELWHSSHGRGQPFKPPRRDAPPAEVGLLETMFADVEAALQAVEFFKTRHTAHVMRTLRSLAHRAELDRREAGFLRAIAIEVVKYGERMRKMGSGEGR